MEEITPEKSDEVFEQAFEPGYQLDKEGRYEEAVQAWQAGLDQIPEPREAYRETAGIISACIGDVYFKKGRYPQAKEYFEKAYENLDEAGEQSPFVVLRLGACCFELGDEGNALQYLLRAYRMEGEEIFLPYEKEEDDGRKYLDFLKSRVELGERGKRKGRG